MAKMVFDLKIVKQICFPFLFSFSLQAKEEILFQVQPLKMYTKIFLFAHF